MNYDLTGRLQRTRMPSLLVQGERDRSVTGEHVQLLLRELPHARLTRYEGAGHMLVLERADRFVRDVDAFVRGLHGNAPQA